MRCNKGFGAGQIRRGIDAGNIERGGRDRHSLHAQAEFEETELFKTFQFFQLSGARGFEELKGVPPIAIDANVAPDRARFTGGAQLVFVADRRNNGF